MSTSQVESVLVEHEAVAEAAVVAAPHKIKGECLYCFVTPKENVRIDTKVVSELKKMVRDEIAPFAQPDFIQVRRSPFMKSLNQFTFKTRLAHLYYKLKFYRDGQAKTVKCDARLMLFLGRIPPIISLD